jgi:hypothetical protein
MQFYWLVLGALTAWRITHFLQAEDGPWNIVIWLRRQAGGGFWGKLLDCFYCLSVWVAAPLALLLGQSWFEKVLLWPSLSAAAILLERVTNNGSRAVPAPFIEDPAEEDSHGVLRTKERATEIRDSIPTDRPPE